MENNLLKLNIIKLKKNPNENLFYLKSRSINNFNSNICRCKCDCECHKNIHSKTSKNRTQIKKLTNNIFNLKLNPQIPRKSITKTIKKNEYTFDPVSITNSTEPNQNIITTSNMGDLNSNNNGYMLYRNDIKDFSIFLNALHRIKYKNSEVKKIQKSSSFKGININRNIILEDDKNFNKNLNSNYYKEGIFDINNKDNNITENENSYSKKKMTIYNNMSLNDLRKNKNFDKINDIRTYQLYSNNSIENIFLNNNKQKMNNVNKEYDLYSINETKQILNKKNQVNNNKLIQKNWIINYNENYNYKKNYILEEKFNTNDNHRISPLGHIVDNFVTMLKDKNIQRNKMIKKNIIKNKNYWYNKYNEDIMTKKRRLEDKCLNNNKLKNNYSCYDIIKKGNPSENTNKKIYNKRKYPINERNNKINKMKEMKANYEGKYNNNKINDNFNFSFNNKYFNNQILSENEKNSKNNTCITKKNEALNKYKVENSKTLLKNSFINYIYKKKDSNKSENKKKGIEIKYINENNKENKLNKDKNIDKKINNTGLNGIKKKNINKNIKCVQNKTNKLSIETFNILIQDKKENKDKNLSKLNDNSFIDKSGLSPSKFEKNIEIQNISNLSYNPNHNLLISKEGLDYSQILLNKSKNYCETVAEKVKKLIMKKASENTKKPSLLTKLNLNTDLTLTDSEKSEKELTDINIIKRNIYLSSKSFFCIYYKYDKISILAFDYENKTFSFHDYSDFDNFEENYKLSLNKGNMFINIGKYFYIITGKNYDLLYMFDSKKKTMNKLCKLNNNHSNGNLIYYENNLICLSGDFNKSVEKYNIKKNVWNNMPEMIKERSGSGVVILNNKYIINLFGYNSPTKKYLSNIEYFDKTNKLNPSWKFIDCNNFSLKIKNFFCYNNNNKIIIVGGSKYNENEKEKMKYNNNFIKIIFSEKNLDKENNVKIEELIGKARDNNKNKNYSFFKGGKKFEDQKDINYEVFDDKYNCHIFKGNKNSHDIYQFHF